MQSSNRPENKRSVMFSNEENQLVFSLLGHGCQSLSMTVIELYETTPPNHKVWTKKGVGVLCFVKDNNRKNYVFRMYCIVKMKLIWEQEIYPKMEYNTPASFMHMFEGDSCIIAFNFCNDTEAEHMREIVQGRIEARTRREAKRQRAQVNHAPNNHVPTTTVDNTFQPTMTTSQKTKRRPRNITKADIGNPQDFKHVQHVGWNKDTGMEVKTIDKAWEELFTKAGISEKEMQDRETRDFVYDFIQKNSSQQVFKDAPVIRERRPPPAAPSQTSLPVPPSPSAAPGLPGPPVPPRSGSKPTPNRAAPPPPPSVTSVSHGPNNHNKSNNVVLPPRQPSTASISSKAPVRPPPMSNAPAPPPPPSMPAMTPVSPPPPMPPMMPSTAMDTSQADGRSALLESIRSGATLRPVAQNTEPADRTSLDARGDLLSEIRKGIQLKPCNEREVKPISPAAEAHHNGVNDLASALSRALAERNRAMHPDDDDSDDESTDSNDDEWDA